MAGLPARRSTESNLGGLRESTCLPSSRRSPAPLLGLGLCDQGGDLVSPYLLQLLVAYANAQVTPFIGWRNALLVSIRNEWLSPALRERRGGILLKDVYV